MMLAALTLPATLAAQEVTPSQAELAAEQRADAAMDQGRYLDAVDTLRPFAFDAVGDPSDDFAGRAYRQYAGWISGGIPDPDIRISALAPADAQALTQADLRDAVSEIVSRARRTRVVVLNEDHGSQRSRAFALEVATALRPLGYTYLAVETLRNFADDATAAAKMKALAHDGYVRRETGVYSQDPIFGAFLRGSLKLGYLPIAYEATNEPSQDATRAQRIAQREEAQAEYLIRRVLEADPRAKLLVYVGLSHVTEAPLRMADGSEVGWMTTRLKAKTGINPLTIDQTEWLEHTTSVRSVGFGIVADRIGKSAAPFRSVVTFSNGEPLVLGRYATAVDLQVAHPRTLLANGRPDWLRGMGLKPLAIPPALRPTSGRRLVQAFGIHEPDEAVPMDQIVLAPGTSALTLMLPSGVGVRFATQAPAK